MPDSRLDQLPRPGSVAVEFELAALVAQGAELLSVELDLVHLLDQLLGVAGLVRGNKTALGVTERQDSRPELHALEGGKLSHLARTTDGDLLALPAGLLALGLLDHVLDVVDETVTGSLGTNVGSTPVERLARQDTHPLVLDLLVGSKQETSLARREAHVTGRHVRVSTNVARQFHGKGFDEAADLVGRLALRVKVGATLTTTDVEARERILENLLKAKEFEDAQVHSRVQTQTTLVRAERAVELNTIAAVHLRDMVVV